jgi:hypothetical protein
MEPRLRFVHATRPALARLRRARHRAAVLFLLIYLAFVGVVTFGHQHDRDREAFGSSRSNRVAVARALPGAAHLCIACELQAHSPRDPQSPAPPPQPGRRIVRRPADPAPAERSAAAALPPSRGPPLSS